MNGRMSADTVIALLDLEPLAEEGGMFRREWGTEHGSAIYFLLRPGDFSALHRLAGPEVWHYYGGDPALLLLLADGHVERLTLGMRLEEGQRPMHVVEAGVWMGAETTGAWTLLGTTMAPPYDPDGFEVGDRSTLLGAYPAATAEIERLTR